MRIYNPLITIFLLLFWFGSFSIPVSDATAAGDLNITGLEAAEKVNGILVEVHLTQPLLYDLYSDKNQTVNVNIYQGKLDTADFNTRKAPEWLDWIRAYSVSGFPCFNMKDTK